MVDATRAVDGDGVTQPPRRTAAIATADPRVTPRLTEREVRRGRLRTISFIFSSLLQGVEVPDADAAG
jgi:hypothetical protein